MNALGSAIYARLSSDATLGAMLSGTTAIYDTTAPQGSTVPYVTFNQQRTTSHATFGVNPAYEDFPIVITAWTQTHAAGSANAILARIQSLLNNYALPVTGHTLMVCQYRSEGPSQPAFILGAIHRTQAHYYEVMLQ